MMTVRAWTVAGMDGREEAVRLENTKRYGATIEDEIKMEA